ncbi:MAG: DUF3800 domain-containing protein [Melioribacter sp.]|nr:DUF3800 domain-containing protein [Melioribacter sp.]
MKKYRIYIDEVGNNDLGSSDNPNHRYLSLTGLIFELDYVGKIVTPSIERLKQKYFPYHPDEPVILHRKEIINKKYPFNSLKDARVEDNFNHDLLKLIGELEYTIVSVLIDKKEHKIKYSTWKYDPYHYCMEILLERFFFFLESNSAVGDVMVESRGGKEDMRLKKSFSNIIENGTNFIDSERLKQRFTSCELKVKPKLLNIACLQLADLLAHPSRRFMFRTYRIDEGKSYIFGDNIIKLIEKKYYRGKSGIEGYGIKLLP